MSHMGVFLVNRRRADCLQHLKSYQALHFPRPLLDILTSALCPHLPFPRCRDFSQLQTRPDLVMGFLCFSFRLSVDSRPFPSTWRELCRFPAGVSPGPERHGAPLRPPSRPCHREHCARPQRPLGIGAAVTLQPQERRVSRRKGRQV